MRTDLTAETYDFGAGQYRLDPNGLFLDIMDTLFHGVQYVHGLILLATSLNSAP